MLNNVCLEPVKNSSETVLFMSTSKRGHNSFSRKLKLCGFLHKAVNRGINMLFFGHLIE